MDDYLAKPVRGKVLENMLVKWAIEGKQQRTLANGIIQLPYQLKEAGIDGEYFATTENRLRPSISHTGSADDITAAVNPEAVGMHHTSSSETIDSSKEMDSSDQSSNDTRLRRAEAQESAISLRNDKLISAANNPRLQHRDAEDRRHTPRLALTEENVEKLADEQKSPHPPMLQGLGLHQAGKDSLSSLQVQLEPHSRQPSGDHTGVSFAPKSPSRLRPSSVRNESSSTVVPDELGRERYGHT